MEQSAQKIFSSGSMALKSTNATCLLEHYVHALIMNSFFRLFKNVYIFMNCVYISMRIYFLQIKYFLTFFMP